MELYCLSLNNSVISVHPTPKLALTHLYSKLVDMKKGDKNINSALSEVYNVMKKENLKLPFFILDNQFSIQNVENHLTGEIALKAIKRHIDAGFKKLREIGKGLKIYFPIYTMTSEQEDSWKKHDPHNPDVHSHLKEYLDEKIADLSLTENVVKGCISGEQGKSICVLFTNKDHLVFGEDKDKYFRIVTTPEAGFSSL
jgi:hypothetical protein